MKLPALTLFALLVGLPLPADDTPSPSPAEPPPVVAEPFPPAHFNSLYIERDEGNTSTIIEKVGDTVTYKVTQAGKLVDSATVTPTPDDWFKFIQDLNQAKVYKWVPLYYYPGPGIQWAVDFTMEDRKFTSAGSNEYPKEGAEDKGAFAPKAGPSIPWQLFWQAAMHLAGKSTAPTPTPAPAK